jgi:hypothetical protein
MAAITRMIAELLGKTIDLKKVTITQEQEKKP